MPDPGQGFVTNVQELARLAADLPAVADALRRPIAVLEEHTYTPRPVAVAAVSNVEREYSAFTDDLARRQRLAADRIDETAQALKEIADVYRRVDGQG